jgi:hypothetical protein
LLTIITKLRKNPAATLNEEYRHGTSVGARYELPAELVSFRTKRAVQELTAKQREERAERLRAVRRAA